MGWEHIIEISSWIAGIGSFILAFYLFYYKKKSSIKQDNEEGLNLIEVSSDKDIEAIKQKNKKGDNKVSL